jgi:alanine racemase
VTRAEVSLDAIAQNITRMCEHVAPASVMAVVKADAYGHGAITVGKTALSHGASRLAVYTVAEGVALRRSGVTAPILVFGPFGKCEAKEIWRHGLTPTLSDLNSAAWLQERSAGGVLKFHLKLDTGLCRAGIAPAHAVAFVRAVAQSFPAVRLEGAYTHFSSADEEDKTATVDQIHRFRETIVRMEREGFSCPLTHASNSAALLEIPEARFKMVRAGISIYGYYPSDSTSRDVPLVPALQLLSEVSRVHTIPPGTGVGYGHEFRATRPTTIALVPIGYGDGMPRTLGNGSGRVILRSRLAPIVGRVSMDQITVDATEIDGVQPGDPVVLIGAQGDLDQSAEELGTQAGTISYDILTGILPRVPRVYVERGAVVATLVASSQIETLAGNTTATDSVE